MFTPRVYFCEVSWTWNFWEHVFWMPRTGHAYILKCQRVETHILSWPSISGSLCTIVMVASAWSLPICRATLEFAQWSTSEYASMHKYPRVGLAPKWLQKLGIATHMRTRHLQTLSHTCLATLGQYRPAGAICKARRQSLFAHWATCWRRLAGHSTQHGPSLATLV